MRNKVFLGLRITLRYAKFKILNHKTCFTTYIFSFSIKNKYVTLQYENTTTQKNTQPTTHIP